MIVNGVKLGGNDVNVMDDFEIHIPYGCCYDIDGNAFTVFRPKRIPVGYKDGPFSAAEGIQCDVFFEFHNATADTVTKIAKIAGIVVKIDSLTNIDIHSFLKEASKKYNDRNFRSEYKVIKDEPYIKVGYFTLWKHEKTLYDIVISRCWGQKPL